MTTEEPAAQPAGTLHRALRMRHLVTLSIGGTVGSGFFLGAGGAISTAGPGVVITYLVAGLVVVGDAVMNPRAYSADGV